MEQWPAGARGRPPSAALLVAVWAAVGVSAAIGGAAACNRNTCHQQASSCAGCVQFTRWTKGTARPICWMFLVVGCGVCPDLPWLYRSGHRLAHRLKHVFLMVFVYYSTMRARAHSHERLRLEGDAY
jgi:hypothetical protein